MTLPEKQPVRPNREHHITIWPTDNYSTSALIYIIMIHQLIGGLFAWGAISSEGL